MEATENVLLPPKSILDSKQATLVILIDIGSLVGAVLIGPFLSVYIGYALGFFFSLTGMVYYYRIRDQKIRFPRPLDFVLLTTCFFMAIVALWRKSWVRRWGGAVVTGLALFISLLFQLFNVPLVMDYETMQAYIHRKSSMHTKQYFRRTKKDRVFENEVWWELMLNYGWAFTILWFLVFLLHFVDAYRDEHTFRILTLILSCFIVAVPMESVMQRYIRKSEQKIDLERNPAQSPELEQSLIQWVSGHPIFLTSLWYGRLALVIMAMFCFIMFWIADYVTMLVDIQEQHSSFLEYTYSLWDFLDFYKDDKLYFTWFVFLFTTVIQPSLLCFYYIVNEYVHEERYIHRHIVYFSRFIAFPGFMGLWSWILGEMKFEFQTSGKTNLEIFLWSRSEDGTIWQGVGIGILLLLFEFKRRPRRINEDFKKVQFVLILMSLICFLMFATLQLFRIDVDGIPDYGFTETPTNWYLFTVCDEAANLEDNDQVTKRATPIVLVLFFFLVPCTHHVAELLQWTYPKLQIVSRHLRAAYFLEQFIVALFVCEFETVFTEECHVRMPSNMNSYCYEYQMQYYVGIWFGVAHIFFYSLDVGMIHDTWLYFMTRDSDKMAIMSQNTQTDLYFHGEL